MDAKQIVKRNKQYRDTPKQNELRQKLEIPYDFRSQPASDYIRNLNDELSRVTLEENIKKNPDEYTTLESENGNITRRLREIEESLVTPQKQNMFSWFGQKTPDKKDALNKEKIELKQLQKDIEAQLPYYKGVTGGTRKLRKKRIKRTRVR